MTILTLDESINTDPIFDVEQVQLQFDLHRSLQQLLVQDNIMYLILTQSVYMIDLSNPSIVKHVELPQSSLSSDTGAKGVRIIGSWLHWNGCHLIVHTNSHQCFYLHASYQHFKILPRFKGYNIKYIAFQRESKGKDVTTSEYTANTGDFLFGTLDGSIYVSLLKSHEIMYHDNKRDDKYVKQVHSGNGSNISGLVYAGGSVVVCSNGELLLWSIGNNSYNDIIKGFRNSPTRIHHSSTTHSQAGHLISNGSTYLYVDADSPQAIESNDMELNLSQRETLTIDSSTSGLGLSSSQNSIVLTKHHILALMGKYNENFAAVVKLSNKEPKIMDTLPDHSGRVLGIVADYLAETYWLYTNNNIFEIIISNESGSVWYNYYKMGKYEEALSCLKEQDVNSKGEGDIEDVKVTAKKDLVLIKQGYSFLQQGGFGIDYFEGEINEELFEHQIKGIKVLAKLSEPFEKVCLMLMSVQSDQVDSQNFSTSIISERLLVEYLLIKFQIAKLEKNKIRMVVLSSWVVELMLRMIYRSSSAVVTEDENSNSEQSLDKQFKSFLSNNYKHFDSITIYQIITGFNYPSKLIYYAELIKDYEFILKYYIELEDWTNLLKTLVKIYTLNDSKMLEVLYRKSTVLLVNSPRETVNTWIKFPSLDYERILPSLLTYNKSIQPKNISENELIRFLQKIIYDKEYNSEIINNYYLSLLISYPTDKEQASKSIIKLLNRVLDLPTRGGKGGHYDFNFILRQCLSYKHFHPAILILINDMKYFDQALKLALDNELTGLAQIVLKKYDDYLFNREENELNGESTDAIVISSDFEEDMRYVGKVKLEEESFSSRKKLWLMFSKFLIESVCNGKKLEFLDDIEVTEEEIERKGDENNKSGNQNVTQSLISEMTSGESIHTAPVDLLIIRKLLKYLLSASYVTQTNSNVLSLKDILPLFPSSIMINNFKTEIIQSLNQYNNKINKLSADMQESLQISTNLKKQIKESQTIGERGKVYTIIEPGEPCGICKELLISKQFVCFPNCSHGFHKDCLVKFYLKLKGEYKFKKIFQNFKRQPSSANKTELDEILLKECVLCNESSINTIDDNIIDLEGERDEAENWVI